MITTFIFLPSLLLSSFTFFNISALFGDKPLSPVIIIYLAGLNACAGAALVPAALVSSSLAYRLCSSSVLKVIASIFLIAGFLVLNKDNCVSPLVKPISSNANATGIAPPSIYWV